MVTPPETADSAVGVVAPGLHSRRALLAGVLGGSAALIASSLSGVQRVLAAGSDGAPVLVGSNLGDVRSMTVLANNTNNSPLLQLANNQSGIGLKANSSGGNAVDAEAGSGGGSGVVATSFSNGLASIHGHKFSGATGPSVKGENTTATNGYAAIYGITNGTGPAVFGEGLSAGNGTSGVARGTGSGVYGQSDNGRGGRFNGKKAQLKLDPSTATTHPSSGDAGDIFLDKSKRLWLCKGGSTWVQIV